MKLQGKVAIVTGASRGIGKAISLKFAEQGAFVVEADIVANVNENLSEISGTETESSLAHQRLAMVGDISKNEDVKRMVNDTIEKFGKIDILVNNAGIMKSSPIEQVSERDWDTIMNVNLKGAFLCSKHVSKHMMSQESGVIINIASIAGLIPEVNVGAYGPSKAGLINLTQIMAMEWAKYDIRVNAICPGPIETAITNVQWPGETHEVRARAIPLKRFGRPNEVASAAVFLACDDASYITGHSLIVDGGSSKSMFHLLNLFMTK